MTQGDEVDPQKIMILTNILMQIMRANYISRYNEVPLIPEYNEMDQDKKAYFHGVVKDFLKAVNRLN